MNTRSISISDYTYTLPEERIAPYPLPERDASRLLVYRQDTITADIYRNISNYLPEGSLLVFNNTRVMEARLLFRKPSGGTIEIFCLEPGEQYLDIAEGMMQQGRVQWKCLIGGASKWKPGQVLQKILPGSEAAIVLEARYITKQEDYFLIDLEWKPARLPFAEILHMAGVMPLPPYIKRVAEEADRERYQTVYAQEEGSVAAPTAGLHFTPAIFERLRQKNILAAYITLHVGAGTFKPVKTATMEGHQMHAEFMELSQAVIRQLLLHLPMVYAVGTTSARTLESLYWMGVKTMLDPMLHPDRLFLLQWEAYEHLSQYAIAPATALQSLAEWMERKGLQRVFTKTQLLIAPGYDFKIIRGMATNFHQPGSTLLLLVAALAGPAWKNIYAYALANDFRFLSYGDGCLLLKD